MRLLDTTFGTAAEHLALEEAVFLLADRDSGPTELLHLWEPDEIVVVVGRGSRVEQEVNVEHCRQRGIPILRRCSGGAAIVTGPGCLMYGVVLDRGNLPVANQIDEAHCFVLQKMAGALRRLGTDIEVAGTSDLTLRAGHSTSNDHPLKKFSGNSLRWGRSQLLYHGTILYNLSRDAIQGCLKMPPRQPIYRQQRSHGEFLSQLSADPKQLREALLEGWQVTGTTDRWPREKTSELLESKYGSDAWNFRH